MVVNAGHGSSELCHFMGEVMESRSQPLDSEPLFWSPAKISSFLLNLGWLAEKLNQLIGSETAKVAAQRNARSRLQSISAVIEARKARALVFPSDLFHDPAWNILLELYASHLQERPVSISDACLFSGTSSTSTLRWITVLIDRGYVYRQPDARDGRRIHIILTETAIEALDLYADYCAEGRLKESIASISSITSLIRAATSSS